MIKGRYTFWYVWIKNLKFLWEWTSKYRVVLHFTTDTMLNYKILCKIEVHKYKLIEILPILVSRYIMFNL